MDLNAIDMGSFLKRLDPVWNSLVHRGGRYYDKPAATRCDWGEAALLGNGQMGAAIYKKTPRGLTLELGRHDAEAHVHLKGVDWSVPRIPIGDLVIETDGEVPSETMRVSLHEATATGTMVTANGVVEWSCFIAAHTDTLALRVVTGGSVKASVRLQPAHGVSPRLAHVTEELRTSASPMPPMPVVTETEGVTLSVQALVDAAGDVSGETAIALAHVREGNDTVYFLSVKHSRNPGVPAREQALAQVRGALREGWGGARERHCSWWSDFYKKSFISIPDTRWEAFYYIQMYKLGSATRGHHPEVIDNQGPWLTDSAWPGTWWNLNVQLSYSPLVKANRLDLAASLGLALQTHEKSIRHNASTITDDGMYLGRVSGRLCGENLLPPVAEIQAGNLKSFELGNFTWIVKLLHDQYLATMDRAFLAETVFPILRSCMNVTMALLTRWEDGKLHLPKTTSPEYPDPRNPANTSSCPAHDTSYDLALLRWGLETLLQSAATLGIQDPLSPKWRDTLRDLTPFCIDEHGFMVARDLPFAVSHRHYSHLFAIYPLGLLDLEKPDEYRLARKSLEHWMGLTGALQGYSFTGAAAMWALMGEGDKALAALNGLREYLLPNTMYVEGGGPVIETPLSGAESLQCLFLQSLKGTVRAFPAVPASFPDVTFAGLRAEGAFLVSGHRSAGVNRWVHIESLAGSPLRVMPNLGDDVRAWAGKSIPLIPDGAGIWRVEIKKGESVILFTGEQVPDLKISPVPSEKSFENYYGSLKDDMGARAQVAVAKARQGR